MPFLPQRDFRLPVGPGVRIEPRRVGYRRRLAPVPCRVDRLWRGRLPMSPAAAASVVTLRSGARTHHDQIRKRGICLHRGRFRLHEGGGFRAAAAAIHPSSPTINRALSIRGLRSHFCFAWTPSCHNRLTVVMGLHLMCLARSPVTSSAHSIFSFPHSSAISLFPPIVDRCIIRSQSATHLRLPYAARPTLNDGGVLYPPVPLLHSHSLTLLLGHTWLRLPSNAMIK